MPLGTVKKASNYWTKPHQAIKVPPMYLGLDVGEKTVGVAASDGLGLTAQPIETIFYKSHGEAWRKLASHIEERNISGVVAGLPLNMNGSEGPSAERVRKFTDGLKRFLLKRKLDIKIEFWDERLSTMGAERSLLEADLSRQKRKKVIDKMAAVFILQGYLDYLRGQRGPSET
jgi:putative Holliday junction resolvase